jgi:lipopolysaccharide transport system permease protein
MHLEPRRSSDSGLSTARPTVVAAPAGPTVTRVPVRTRIRWGDIPRYAPVIRAIATRDLKARYKQSLLGPAWTLFQPLGLLVAFSVGFNAVAHVNTGGVPYYLFALTGLAVWTYFQAVLMLATGSIVNNYPIVRWTACPRLALPLAALVSNLPSFLIPAAAAIVAAIVTDHVWVGSLLLPVLILWMFVLVAVFAVALAVITVRARDILSALPFVLQVAVFLTPVAYSTANLSAPLRTLVAINPLTGLIEAWRWALLDLAPSWRAVGTSLLLTAVGVVLAWRVFARMEPIVADEI